jgi:hypothetical protein
MLIINRDIMANTRSQLKGKWGSLDGKQCKVLRDSDQAGRQSSQIGFTNTTRVI